MSERVLDEVRESYAADMGRFLDVLDRSADAASRSAMLSDLAEPDDVLRGHLLALGVHLHAIRGTSALVGVTTLVEPVRQLEELADAGVESLRQIDIHVARLRAVVGAVTRSVPLLKALVAAELDSERAKADQLAAELGKVAPPAPARASSQPVPSVLPRLVPPPPPVAAGPHVDELHAVFEEEAREALTLAEAELDRLARRHDDLEAIAGLTRVLHQLKGASASVGLDDVSARLRTLYELAGASREAPVSSLDPATVKELRAGVGRLTAELRPALPPVIPAVATAADESVVADDDEPRALFFGEMRRALGEIDPLYVRIADRRESGASRMAALARLERVFHRLKGSALVVGETSVAALVARGQELCEPSGTSVTPEEITAVIDDLRRHSERQGPAVPVARPLPRLELQLVAVPGVAQGELWEAFVEESSELLDGLDRGLAALERSAAPAEDLAEMMRSYHTLKGAASSVGLDPVGAELHLVESFIERLGAHKVLPPLGGMVSALAEVQRRLRRNVAQIERGAVDSAAASLARVLDALLDPGAREPSTGSWLTSADAAWSSHGGVVTDDRSQASHASRPRGEELVADEAERRFVRVPVERLDGLMDMVGELVVWRSRLIARLDRLRGLHDHDGEQRRRIVGIVESFAAQTEFVNLGGKTATRAPAAPAIRRRDGDFGTLELDQYEEIHVFSRRLAEAASDLGENTDEIDGELEHLADDTDAITTIVSGLQSEITRSRMVPLQTLFARLHLPTRDAAARAAKSVDIAVNGEGLAIDKAIADALYGPMLHLVRNAVAHGIELERDRHRAGKPIVGRILLTARQKSGQIVIEVSDDGAGLDRAALRAAGAARGLVAADHDLDDPAVLDLVFASGLSTSARVGDLAGRGVGCDVVRRTVERLNGTIRVSSAAGVGTTFTIVLPVTMSITRAVLARAGGRVLAVPMFFSERIVEVDDASIVDSAGRRRLVVDGAPVPFKHAAELFGEPIAVHGPIVVCLVGEHRIGIQVDAVLGAEEIVVKSLGEVLDGHPLFAGATLRGDGEIALILDVPGAHAEIVGATTPRRTAAVEPLAGALAADAGLEPDVASVGAVRVMFVDDSLSVRKVAERTLRGLGVDVVLAVDGQDALEKLRDAKVTLIFTDLEMPRMHGLDLIRELRYIPTYRDIPIVVVSSRSGTKHVEHATALGAREYVTKPFTAELIAEVLHRHTGFRRPS